jgi:hypothetical protein
VSEPDGSPLVDGDWAGSVRGTKNHLYGTFTAAKERAVEVGRKVSAAKAAAARAERPNPAAAALASCDRGGDNRKIGIGPAGGVVISSNGSIGKMCYCTDIVFAHTVKCMEMLHFCSRNAVSC